MWSRGIWVARAAGIGLIAAGVITALGIVDLSDQDSMMEQMPAMQEQMGVQEPPGQTPGIQEPDPGQEMAGMQDQMSGMDM